MYGLLPLLLHVCLWRPVKSLIKQPRKRAERLDSSLVFALVGAIQGAEQGSLVGKELEDGSSGGVGALGVLVPCVFTIFFSAKDILDVLVGDLVPLGEVFPRLHLALEHLPIFQLDLLQLFWSEALGSAADFTAYSAAEGL